MVCRSGRVRVLGCIVDVVSMAEAVAAIGARVDARHRDGLELDPAVIVTLNPEMVVRAQNDAQFMAILDRAFLVVADGIGVVRAVRRRGYAGAVRVSGIDLLQSYLEVAARCRHRVAFCGGAPGVAAAAAARVRRTHPGVEIVAADGGDPTSATARRLAAAVPDVVCAAYGAGVQERFLDAHLGESGATLGIGVGGALDYLAGRVRRAPRWVRAAGLEWAWRLARQPWRWRRQAALPRFWWAERREARLLARAPS